MQAYFPEGAAPLLSLAPQSVREPLVTAGCSADAASMAASTSAQLHAADAALLTARQAAAAASAALATASQIGRVMLPVPADEVAGGASGQAAAQLQSGIMMGLASDGVAAQSESHPGTIATGNDGCECTSGSWAASRWNVANALLSDHVCRGGQSAWDAAGRRAKLSATPRTASV